eukprot:269380-Chlamydomonas_euryale.AAC.3
MGLAAAPCARRIAVRHIADNVAKIRTSPVPAARAARGCESTRVNFATAVRVQIYASATCSRSQLRGTARV